MPSRLRTSKVITVAYCRRSQQKLLNGFVIHHDARSLVLHLIATESANNRGVLEVHASMLVVIVVLHLVARVVSCRILDEPNTIPGDAIIVAMRSALHEG